MSKKDEVQMYISHEQSKETKFYFSCVVLLVKKLFSVVLRKLCQPTCELSKEQCRRYLVVYGQYQTTEMLFLWFDLELYTLW